MISLSIPEKLRFSVWIASISIIILLLFLSDLSNKISISGYLLSIFIVFTLVLVSSLKATEKRLAGKVLKSTILFLVFVSVLYILLNIINVYELVKTKSAVSFCEENAISCALIKESFFRFKFYRFITLSIPLFSWLVILISLNRLALYKNILKFLKKSSRLRIIMILYISIIMIVQTKGIVLGTYSTFIKIPQQLSTPYADRFVDRMQGNNYFGWIYTYTKFIKEHTPDEAIILIPPQKYAWEMEGNAGYVRWFLYPRYVRSSSDLSPEIPDDVKFVMISYGTWWSKIHGWPQINIPAEKIKKIWLINRQTLDQEELVSVDYQYKEGQELWGLIELK